MRGLATCQSRNMSSIIIIIIIIVDVVQGKPGDCATSTQMGHTRLSHKRAF